MGKREIREIDDIPKASLPIFYTPPIDRHNLKRSDDKSPVSDTFSSQRLGSLDRPPRPLRYSPVQLHTRFILVVGMVLMLVVVGATVFIKQSLASHNLPLSATKTPVSTATTIHTPISNPTPIQVFSTCTGSACDGKNPRNDHGPHGVACWNDNAYVVASQLVKYGVVHLWYSIGCGTNWAETLQTRGTSYIENANITRSSDNRHYNATAYVSDIWTVMVYASGTRANACGSINNANGGCSGFH